MNHLENKIIKIEQELSILNNAVEGIKTSLEKIDNSLALLVELQTETKLLDQQIQSLKDTSTTTHKSISRRLEKLEGTVSWIAKTIIGTLLTGSIGVLFFILRKVI